jgi:hypothetical protein
MTGLVAKSFDSSLPAVIFIGSILIVQVIKPDGGKHELSVRDSWSPEKMGFGR